MLSSAIEKGNPVPCFVEWQRKGYETWYILIRNSEQVMNSSEGVAPLLRLKSYHDVSKAPSGDQCRSPEALTTMPSVWLDICNSEKKIQNQNKTNKFETHLILLCHLMGKQS